ncbi:hypothetical protein FACS189499_03220 [Clostridia bacterium]|nr:hypothetical protein FACS189499_03220 [Clostridia bacterium]
MKDYKIAIRKQAEKFINSQNKEQRERLYKAIYNLPNGTDIKPLKSSGKAFRLRVGSFRVIFERDDDVLIVTVVNADNRGQVYKKI